MKRIPVTVAGLGLLLMATIIRADSPHFLFANNSITNTFALSTAFKEVGLGTGTSSVTITLTANATGVFQCFNNGGNHPKAGNKETVNSTLRASGNFPVTNGQTSATLSVGPPSPGNFSCPSGQSLFIQSVTYSNTIVSDAFGNNIDATPDPIGTGPIHVPVP